MGNMLLGLAVVVLGAAVAFWVRRAWRLRREEAARAEAASRAAAEAAAREAALAVELAAAHERFDARAAVAAWLAAEPELAGLYERFGDSLPLEQRTAELLDRLKAEVRTEIPDFAAFRAALAQAAATELLPASDEPLARARAERAADPLLAAVMAAGDDEAAVLDLLDRSPVDGLLPFLEEAPFVRGGVVVWRTPFALDALHKKPGDAEVFLRLLGELRSLVRTARLPRPAPLADELLAAIDRLREVVEDGTSYVVTPLRATEEKLLAWREQPQGSAGADRRRELEDLLATLARARHEAELLERAGSPGDLGQRREQATALAQRYLSAPWLATPVRAVALLELLLGVEGAALREATPGAGQPALELLRTVVDETASRRFDPEETVRRLRSLEASGLIVHSLVYGLLRQLAPPS